MVLPNSKISFCIGFMVAGMLMLSTRLKEDVREMSPSSNCISGATGLFENREAELRQRIADLEKELEAKKTPVSPVSRKVLPFAQWFEIKEPTIALKGLPPSLVVDVGAHVGWTVRDAAKHGHRVIAFEPDKQNCAKFQSNMKEYQIEDRVTLHCAGVAAQTGFGRLAGAQNGRTSDGTSSVGSFSTSPCSEGQPGCLKSYALDDVVKERVKLLKIDVQGGEFNVLKGAEKLFDTYGVDMVFVETTRANKNYLDWLYGKGYTCMDFPYLTIGSTKPNAPGRVEIEKGTLTTGNPMAYYVEKTGSSDLDYRRNTVLGGYAQNDYLCVKI